MSTTKQVSFLIVAFEYFCPISFEDGGSQAFSVFPMSSSLITNLTVSKFTHHFIIFLYHRSLWSPTENTEANGDSFYADYNPAQQLTLQC